VKEDLFSDVMEYTPAVFEILEKTLAYAQTLLEKSTPAAS